MPVAYKQELRTALLKPLEVLSLSDQPLTMRELSTAFEHRPELAVEIRRKFPTLKLWRLIEEVERHKYAVTLAGMRFIQGFDPLPEFVFTLNNEVIPTPDGQDHPRLRHAWQFRPEFSEPRPMQTSLPV